MGGSLTGWVTEWVTDSIKTRDAFASKKILDTGARACSELYNFNINFVYNKQIIRLYLKCCKFEECEQHTTTLNNKA
jgi:hypothetical protein